MRGFRNTLGISDHSFVTNILILFTLGTVLFNSGCSGFVNASNRGGTPGSLTISSVEATNANPTSVGIGWQTNAPANSQIEYGTTTSYGSTTAVDSTMVTSHQLTVSSLKPGTAYHCRVHSKDAQNISAVSGDLACSTSTDTTPPTVSITSPPAHTTHSRTVRLTPNPTSTAPIASVKSNVHNTK